jgi:hypothetical protein
MLRCYGFNGSTTLHVGLRDDTCKSEQIKVRNLYCDALCKWLGDKLQRKTQPREEEMWVMSRILKEQELSKGDTWRASFFDKPQTQSMDGGRLTPTRQRGKGNSKMHNLAFGLRFKTYIGTKEIQLESMRRALVPVIRTV